MLLKRRILPMTKGDQQRITQHKRFVLYSTHPNFCFAKTSFMLGTLAEIAPPNFLRNAAVRGGKE